jgi:hypothetical protein
LPKGKIVPPIFRQQLSSPDHDCDSRERSAAEASSIGDQRKTPDLERGDDTSNS